MKRFQRFLFTLLILMTIQPVYHASAQETASCGSDYGSQVSATVKLNPDAPDFYVRADRSEDAVRSRLYFQSYTEDSASKCELIGEVVLSTATWQRIGGQQNTSSGLGTLYLTLDSSDPSDAGASSPLVIMSSAAPPCVLATSCSVSYEDETYELAPKKVSLGSDSLRVGLLSDTANDSIKQVIYSVDGKQAYVKKTLEPFNERYIAGGEHSAERTIVLSSGQSLTDKRTVTKGTFGDPGYWLTSTYTRYSKLFLYVGTLLGAFIIGIIWMSVARIWYKRRMWRMTHIAQNTVRAGAAKPLKYDGSIKAVFREHSKLFFVPFFGLLLIVFTFSFVLNIFRVDGVSMEPTLHDQSQKFLLTLPASIGKLNGSGYVPARGEIIVVAKDDNNLFDTANLEQKEYVVKRVIALPEERVVIANGVIKVFNASHKDGFIPDDEYGWIKDKSGSEYIKLDITLKQNELFVVGDNRDESIDSRYYGPITASQVIGEVL